MSVMSTVSEVLDDLKAEGYTADFNLNDNCLICHENALRINPEEFKVDKYYRFEGASDPGDSAIIYAISSTKHNIKGTLLNGFGISADAMTNDMIKALSGKEAEAKKVNITPKYNEATNARPEGNRPIDAEMVRMNLSEQIVQIKQEKAWKEGDRNAITLFKTEKMRIVLIALHEGAEMKTHTAPGLISVQVLQGEIAFTTAKITAEMRTGEMLALHAGIAHSVFARQESVFLLTMAVTEEKK